MNDLTQRICMRTTTAREIQSLPLLSGVGTNVFTGPRVDQSGPELSRLQQYVSLHIMHSPPGTPMCPERQVFVALRTHTSTYRRLTATEGRHSVVVPVFSSDVVSGPIG
jgi:hypothetical protein